MPRRSRRSQVGARMYGEAFPCIDIHALEKSHRAGKPICEWVNEAGIGVGHIEVRRVDAASVTFEQHFYGAANVGLVLGEITISLVWKAHLTGVARACMQCPKCQRDCSKIYLVARRWGCKYCHDLTNIRKRLNKVTSIQRHLIELAYLLSENKLRYVRKTKIQHMKNIYEILLRQAVDFPPLHPELGFMQFASWKREGEPIAGRYDSDQPAYSYPKGDGGFQRIEWQLRNEGRPATPAEVRRYYRERERLEIARLKAENLMLAGTAPIPIEPSKDWGEVGGKATPILDFDFLCAASPHDDGINPGDPNSVPC